MALTTLTKIGKGVTSFFKAKGATHARELSDRFSDVINVKDYGAIGDGITDDSTAIQKALDALGSAQGVYFPRGDYAISTMLVVEKNDICIYGQDKRSSRIVPHNNWDHSEALMRVGNGHNYQITIKDLMFYNSKSEVSKDSDGLIVWYQYNCDILDCAFTGGDYVTRETAGLRIWGSPLHTRIINCQLHNCLCYSLAIHGHQSDLSIVNCALNEAPIGIKSLGDIVEMRVENCGFGSAWPNPWYPTPNERINVDLRLGDHGTIIFTGNNFTGGAGTYFHIRWKYVNLLNITSNTFRNAGRYSLCSETGSRTLNICGNIFEGNGAEGTSINPADGVRNPDSTSFCSDIFINEVFTSAISICSNTTNISNRISLWAEGSSSPVNTITLGNISIVGNSSDFKNYAYVKSTNISTREPLCAGSIVGRLRFKVTIPNKTIPSNTADWIQVTIPSVYNQDSVVSLTPVGNELPQGLILTPVYDNNSGFIKIYLYNLSSHPIQTGVLQVNLGLL